MWRHPAVNLGFLILVLIFFSLQHPATEFGPSAPSRAVTDSGAQQISEWILGGQFPRSLHATEDFNRAADMVKQTWHRVEIFNEWMMEYNTSQWKIYRASSSAETDLLETRYHVANAEVFTEALGEKKRAIKELGRAEQSLQAAQKMVKSYLSPQLTTIQDEIKAEEINEQTAETFSAQPFDAIKANLDHVIESLRLSRT